MRSRFVFAFGIYYQSGHFFAFWVTHAARSQHQQCTVSYALCSLLYSSSNVEKLQYSKTVIRHATRRWQEDQKDTRPRTVSLQSHSLNAKRNRERTVHANVSESCACAWLLVPRGWVLRCVVLVVEWLARWEGGCAPSGVRPLRAPGSREAQRRGRKALRRWRRRRPRGVAAPGPRRPSPLRCACRPRAARWPSPPRPSSTRPWPRAPSRARRAPPTTAARA